MFFLLEKVHHLMPSLDISHVNRSRSKRALLFVLLEKQSKSVLLGPTLEPPHWPIIFVVYGTRTFESVGAVTFTIRILVTCQATTGGAQ